MCIHTNPCNEPFNCISNKSFNFSSDNFMLLGASGCQQGGLSLILSWILLSFVQKYQIALSYYGFSSRLKIYILVMLLLFVWIVWIFTFQKPVVTSQNELFKVNPRFPKSYLVLSFPHQDFGIWCAEITFHFLRLYRN